MLTKSQIFAIFYYTYSVYKNKLLYIQYTTNFIWIKI